MSETLGQRASGTGLFRIVGRLKKGIIISDKFVAKRPRRWCSAEAQIALRNVAEMHVLHFCFIMSSLNYRCHLVGCVMNVTGRDHFRGSDWAVTPGKSGMKLGQERILGCQDGLRVASDDIDQDASKQLARHNINRNCLHHMY